MSPLIIGPDPGWQAEISQRWGNALASVQQIIENKRAKEERDLQRSIELLTQNPELADTLGNDMMRKYGRKRPEIVSLVSTIQEQKKLREESEANLTKYERAVNREITERQKFAQGLEEMPDTVFQPTDPFGGGVPVPNTFKQAARSQMATLPDPGWSAYANMPEDERLAATVAMRRYKLDMPKPPETLGPKDLSQAVRDLYASGYGLTSPEVGITAQSQAGLRLSPEQEAIQEAEKNKNARELQEQLEKEEREKTEARAIADYRADVERGLIRYREGFKTPDERQTPEEKKAETRRIEQIESNLAPRVAGSKARKAATPSPKEVAKAKRTPDTSDDPQGPPPAFPSKYVKDQVAEMALEAVKTFGVDPDSASKAALDLYDLGMAKTHDPKKALAFMRRKMDEDIALLRARQQ